MTASPFLLRQKPIVRAPVCGVVRHACTDWLSVSVAPVVFSLTVAVLLYVTQPPAGIGTVLEYVYVVVPVAVPSVTVVPFQLSVTVALASLTVAAKAPTACENVVEPAGSGEPLESVCADQ